MIPKRKGSYKTTWAGFFVLLALVIIVFQLTKTVKAPKFKGALNYEQLIAKVKTSPTEVEEVTVNDSESIMTAKLKEDFIGKRIYVKTEDRRELLEDLEKAKIPVKFEPLEKSKSWMKIQGPFFTFEFK